jgi:hypothetical protein
VPVQPVVPVQSAPLAQPASPAALPVHNTAHTLGQFPAQTATTGSFDSFVHLVTAPSVAVDTADRRTLTDDVISAQPLFPVPIDPRRRQPVGGTRIGSSFERLTAQPTASATGEEFSSGNSGTRAASRADDSTDSLRGRTRKRLRVAAVSLPASTAREQPSRLILADETRSEKHRSEKVETFEEKEEDGLPQPAPAAQIVKSSQVRDPATVESLQLCQKQVGDHKQRIEELENRTKLHIDYANEKQLEIEQLLTEIESLQNETALFEESVESFEAEIRNVTNILIKKDQDIIKLMEDNNMTTKNLRNIITEKERIISAKAEELIKTNSTVKKLTTQLKALASSKAERDRESREQTETVKRLREEKDNLLRIVQQLARINNPNITFTSEDEPTDYDEEEKEEHARRLAAMLEQEINSTPSSSEVGATSGRPERGSDFSLDVNIVQKYVNSIREERHSSTSNKSKDDEDSRLDEIVSREVEEDLLGESIDDDFLSTLRENRGITSSPAEESIEAADESTTTSSSLILPQETKEIIEENEHEGSSTATDLHEEPLTTVFSAVEYTATSSTTEQLAAAHRMEPILIESVAESTTEQHAATSIETTTNPPPSLFKEEPVKDLNLSPDLNSTGEVQLSPLEQHAAIENGPPLAETTVPSREQLSADNRKTADNTENKKKEDIPSARDEVLKEVHKEEESLAETKRRESRQEETPTTVPTVAEGWEGSFIEAISDHVSVDAGDAHQTEEEVVISNSTEFSTSIPEAIRQEMEQEQLEVEVRDERDYSVNDEEDEDEMAKMHTEAQLLLLSQEMMAGHHSQGSERFERDYRRDDSSSSASTSSHSRNGGEQRQRDGRSHEGDGDGSGHPVDDNKELSDIIIPY